MSIEAITSVLQHSQLRGTAKLVLISLAWHANGEGLAWPSQATLARQSGRISVRQVRKCLAQAVAAGDIINTGLSRRNVVVWRLAILDGKQPHPGTPVPGSQPTPELQFLARPRNSSSAGRNSSAPTPELQDRDPGTAVPTNLNEPLIEPLESSTTCEQAAVDDWNKLAAKLDLRPVQRLTPSRRSALTARLREAGGLNGWRAALDQIHASPFLHGQNDTGWRVSFDWLLKETNFAKILENNYETWDQPANGDGRDARGRVSRRRANHDAAFAALAAIADRKRAV